MNKERITTAYQAAAKRYAEWDVMVEDALTTLKNLPLSLHCWQGDDGGGFERPNAVLSGGGILATGNHPGKPRNMAEFRADLERALTMIPGPKRVNLHAIYGEFGDTFVDRDQIEVKHFAGWMDWAKKNNVSLDFNSTLYSHPKAADGLTLSHPDGQIREFWKEHVRRARRIAAAMGRFQGNPCIHNLWIPDGTKDFPADRLGCRQRLLESLDAALAEKLSVNEIKDAVEGKLFGIGSESFVVGSNDFYYGYALSRKTLLTLDMGHYHPTESVGDKISSVMLYIDEILLHVSRGVRWDSDHVVVLNDELLELCRELVRAKVLNRTHVGLDFFDATINRVGAWALGARSTQKALLWALLEPHRAILDADAAGHSFERLALHETFKTLPWAAIWDQHCLEQGVPTDEELVEAVHSYERRVQLRRG